MKKLVLLSLFLLVVPGCYDNDPLLVAMRWSQAVFEKDANTAFNLMTPLAANRVVKALQRGDIQKVFERTVKVKTEKIPRPPEGNLTQGYTEVVFELRFCTTKIEGKWKVCSWK